MLKNASTIFLGTLIGQFLPLVIAPVLTRFVSPEQFGVFALLLTIVGFASYASGGRYEAGLVIPERDEEARTLAQLVLGINGIFFAVGLLVTVVALVLVGSSEHFGLEWLSLPVMILGYGLINLWENWANRSENYRGIAYSRITRGCTIAVLQVGLLMAAVPGLAALVIGQAVGMLASFIAGLLADRRFARSLIEHWSWPELKRVASKYSNYPRYNTVHGLIHAAQAPLTLLAIGAFCGQAALGAFGLVQRVLQAPSGLVGTAVSPVLLRELVRTESNEERQKAVMRILMMLGALSVPMFAVVMIWGPALFQFAFGDQWLHAGEIAQVYAPYLMMSFIAAPLAVVGQAARKMQEAMYASVAGNVLYLSILVSVLASGGSLIRALAILSVAFLIYFVAYLSWVVRISRTEVSYG